MKKTFSLLEMVIAMGIFSIVISLITPFLREFYHLNFKTSKQNEAILSLNSALLFIDKLFSSCIQSESYNDEFYCILKDEASIFSLEKHRLTLANSSLIVEKNGTLYSPKSDFNFALTNRQNLFADKQKIVYILKDDKIQSLVFENQKILNTHLGRGIFTLLQSRLALKLENKILKYELRPRFFSDEFMQSGIILTNVTQFMLKNVGDKFLLKLCVQEEDFKHCLQKSLR